MIKNRKNYFSFFGILLATVNRKMHSSFCTIASMMALILPTKLLIAKQLKAIKQNSTNSI